MEEWRDNARIRYGLRPAGLCEWCDGVCCNVGFSVEHVLSFKKGGVVGQRHVDVCNEAGEIWGWL